MRMIMTMARPVITVRWQSMPITDAASLRGQARESIGGALAAVWGEHPEMEERDLKRLRGW